MHFINSPIGVVCLLVILVTALINIYAHWIEDGLVGRMLYMAAVLTCAAGLWHYADNTIPEHLTTTLLSLLAAIFLRCTAVKSYTAFKYRRTIHAKKHLR